MLLTLMTTFFCMCVFAINESESEYRKPVVEAQAEDEAQA